MKEFPIQNVEFTGSTVRVEALPLGVKRLVLARPTVRNAFNQTMIAEIQRALDQLGELPAADLRLLVLAGEGSHFCAGADVGYMREAAGRGLAESLEDARNLAQMFFRLAGFEAPVLAVVQGAAIGGGLGLTACSDFVLAEDGSLFATTEVRLGITPAVISPYIVRKVGAGRAASFILNGRRMAANEALALGVVQRLAPSAELESVAQEVILDFLRAGPQAARRAKALLRREAPLPDTDLFEFTAQNIAEARCSEEAQTGLVAFFEKKTPPWAEDVDAIAKRLRD